MSANNTRDDFTEETKRIAGERVCLRCSICGCPTKAASYEGNDKVVSIGVAAHITAAAPGGPRYDPNITPDQRRSIDNCIWLCQNDARLIDRDVVRFSVEHLIAKKKEAEYKAALALEDSKNCIENIKVKGFDVDTTYDILNETIVTGNYLKLKILLDSIEICEDDRYSDAVSYFQIVYDFYCNRHNLNNSIEKYLQRDSKRYIDNLVELFAQFFELDYLRKTIKYCDNDELLKIAQKIIDGTLLKLVRNNSEINDNIPQINIELNSLMHKCITNMAIDKGVYHIADANGNAVPFYNGEYYYKKRAEIVTLRDCVIRLTYIKEQKLNNYEEFNSFINDIDKIKSLDTELQVFFWENILNIVNCIGFSEDYDRLFLECREEVRTHQRIYPLIKIHDIEYDVCAVSFDEIRSYCEICKSYRLMAIYLTELVNKDSDKADKIFNENKYILNKDISLLAVNLQLKQAKLRNRFSSIKFLESYYEIYAEDFSYHVLMAYYLIGNNRGKLKIKKELEWLDSHINDTEFSLPDLERLIYVYSKTKNYKQLVNFYKQVPPILYQLQIAESLFSSGEIKYIEEAKNICLNIESEHKDINGLSRCLFNCYFKLGDMANAKKSLCKEIDLNPTRVDIYNLLLVRLSTNDFLIDKYIEKAGEFVDAPIYHLLGEIYFRANDVELSKNYLLKSLLLDDSNLECLISYFIQCMGTVEHDAPINVDVGVTAIIKNDRNQKQIAIYKDGFLQNISPNCLAGCEHLEESDKLVQDIMLSEKGSKVKYRGEEYVVESLVWTDAILSAFIMSYLIQKQKVIAIKGDTPELAVAELIKYVKNMSESTEKAVELYNKSDTKPPISMFCSMVGKKYIEMLDFLLYENSAKIKNLVTNYDAQKSNIFVLSPDVLYTLACLDIGADILSRVRCLCPIMVKRILIGEINSLIDDCKDKRNVGQMYSKNGVVFRSEHSTEQRKARLKFLNTFKKLIESIEAPQQEYNYLVDNELKELFVKRQILIESDLLGCVQNIENTVIVNDDNFISTIILYNKLSAIGINKFLTVLDLDFEMHLEYIKKLAMMNYGNYITIDVYMHLKNKIFQESDENKRDEYMEDLFDLLTSKFLEKDSEKWHYNNEIVRFLAQTLLESTHDRFDDFILRRAVLYNYSQEYPDEYKAKIDALSKKKFIVIPRIEGDKILIETKIED